MQSFTDHSRQLRLHLFKVFTVLKFTGIIYSSVRKSLRNVCDVLVEMMAILLEYQAGVYGFRTIKFDMRVSESTVLILNEIAACANLGSLMLDIQAVVSA